MRAQSCHYKLERRAGAIRVAGGVDRLLLTTFLRPSETGETGDKGELSRVLLSSDVLHHRRRPTVLLPTSWSRPPKNSGHIKFSATSRTNNKSGGEIKLFSDNTLYTLYKRTRAHGHECTGLYNNNMCVHTNSYIIFRIAMCVCVCL